LKRKGTSDGLRLPTEAVGKGRGDVSVALHPSKATVPESSNVAPQISVLLSGGIEQHVHTRQAHGGQARIGPGVVDTVRQQQHPGVSSEDPSQLAGRDLQWERDVGEAGGGCSRQEVADPAALRDGQQALSQLFGQQREGVV
jgi:hypothetical protein